jgi:hypothetical protein
LILGRLIVVLPFEQRDERVKALFSIAPAWQRIACIQKGSAPSCFLVEP